MGNSIALFPWHACVEQTNDIDYHDFSNKQLDQTNDIDYHDFSNKQLDQMIQERGGPIIHTREIKIRYLHRCDRALNN